MVPSINRGPNGAAPELDLSSSASIAFVCISAFFCCILVLAYCQCYFNEIGVDIWSLLRKTKPASPLLLPLVIYSKAEELTRGCVVCLDDFEDREAVKVIPACGHVFHPQCIDQWLVVHRSCPVCRCSRIYGGGDNGSECRCSRIYWGGDNGSESDEDGTIATEVGSAEAQVVVRLERSRSWYKGASDDGGQRMGMRRTCSF